MTDDRFKFTRRRVLGGIGGIGLASAAAGVGTAAYLNDAESFEGNSITAGELNLQVTVDELHHSTDIVLNNTTITPKDTADGNAVTITIADVKPGDWLILEWNPEIFGNPGYVQVTSVEEDYGNTEGTNTEPESDTAAPGDLGDALLSTIWAAFPSMGTNPRGDLEQLDTTTDNNDTNLATYEVPDEDGVTASGAHYTTMNEAHDVYKTGVLLRDPTTGDPLEIGPSGGGVSFYQLLEVPAEVGNEIQGDVLTFTLRFDAEQARNNDAPFST